MVRTGNLSLARQCVRYRSGYPDRAYAQVGEPSSRTKPRTTCGSCRARLCGSFLSHHLQLEVKPMSAFARARTHLLHLRCRPAHQLREQTDAFPERRPTYTLRHGPRLASSTTNRNASSFSPGQTARPSAFATIQRGNSWSSLTPQPARCDQCSRTASRLSSTFAARSGRASERVRTRRETSRRDEIAED